LTGLDSTISGRIACKSSVAETTGNSRTTPQASASRQRKDPRLRSCRRQIQKQGITSSNQSKLSRSSILQYAIFIARRVYQRKVDCSTFVNLWDEHVTPLQGSVISSDNCREQAVTLIENYWLPSFSPASRALRTQPSRSSAHVSSSVYGVYPEGRWVLFSSPIHTTPSTECRGYKGWG
jgi:hypothetical protein